jgi:hypothetical protein
MTSKNLKLIILPFQISISESPPKYPPAKTISQATRIGGISFHLSIPLDLVAFLADNPKQLILIANQLPD